MEEMRIRAATLLSKVFLHHLTPLLSLPTFTALWLTILDFMDRYMHVDKSDLLVSVAHLVFCKYCDAEKCSLEIFTGKGSELLEVQKSRNPLILSVRTLLNLKKSF
jgi:hypothetical protein